MEGMKGKAGLIGLVGLVLVFASTEALARGWGGGRGRGWGQGRGMGQAQATPVDLTAAQASQIEALRTQFIKQSTETQAILDVKRAEKQRLMMAEKIDRQAVNAKDAELEALRQQLRKTRLAHRLDVLEILTPAQRAAWMNRPGWAGRSGNWGQGKGLGQGRGRGMRGCRGGGWGGGSSGW